MCDKEMKFKNQEKIPNRGTDFKGAIEDFWECSCGFIFFDADEEDLE